MAFWPCNRHLSACRLLLRRWSDCSPERSVSQMLFVLSFATWRALLEDHCASESATCWIKYWQTPKEKRETGFWQCWQRNTEGWRMLRERGLTKSAPNKRNAKMATDPTRSARVQRVPSLRHQMCRPKWQNLLLCVSMKWTLLSSATVCQRNEDFVPERHLLRLGRDSSAGQRHSWFLRAAELLPHAECPQQSP